jgi:hypothetical protein
MRLSFRPFLFALFPAGFALAAILVQWHVGAYATDRGQTSDEAAHFVTALMIADYLRHLGANPIAFAKDYYVHLPRVAIGNWPPFFETLQAAVFALFGGTNRVALGMQAAILGLVAGLPAALLARRHGLIAGLLAGLLIFCNSTMLFLVDTVMADNLLGLLVFLAAWSWSWLYARPSFWSAAAFSAAATAAILTKGSAIGLLALPFLYVAVIRDFGFLLRRWTLISLLAILALTVPWYVATYRIVSGGWYYSWGSFTLVAAPFFAKALFGGLGIPCALGFLVGVWRAFRSRLVPEPDMIAFSAAALVEFAFILLVPADLQARYLIPVFPSAALVAVWGIMSLAEDLLPGHWRRPLLAPAASVLLVAASVWQGFAAPHVEPFRTPEALARIGQSKNPFLLVSGSTRFEGAMIATVAAADRAKFYYALRASKLLSSSSFTGAGYRQRFAGAVEMRAWLIDNQIGWIVLDTSPESMRFDHNALLLAVAKSDPEVFHPVWQATRADGDVLLFETKAAGAPPRHPETVLADQAPSKVPGE